MNITTTSPQQSPIPRAEAMELAKTAYSRLVDVLESVEGDQWQLPTDCERWTVRDMAGHILGAMRAAASERELISQQLASLRRSKREGVALVDAMTQEQIDRTASVTNAALIAECRSLVTRAMKGRRRTPAPVRKLVKIRVRMNSLDERWSIGYLTDTILTRDAWLHRIDLCRAIGVSPVLTPEHDGRIVGDVVAEWKCRHGQPVSLTLTGGAGGSFDDGDATAAQLQLDAVEFCRFLSRRAAGTGLLATEVPF